MAIAFTNLGVSSGTTTVAPDLRNFSDLTQYTLASWNPPDNGIMVLCIYNQQNTITDTTIDSLTGNGNVWELVGGTNWNSAGRRITVYAAKGSQLTTDVTTIEFGADTQIGCIVSVFQITGADESGSAAGAFGLIEASSATAASASHNWAGSPANSDSRPLYFVVHAANEAVSAPGSLTSIDDFTMAGPAEGAMSAWESAGFTDPSDSFTWTTSILYGLLALEIKAAGGAPPAVVLLRPTMSPMRW
jgi:hypothetical protein